jgi:phosphoribosylaminoimidazole carboxylase (NCAIR synthetase)
MLCISDSPYGKRESTHGRKMGHANRLHPLG